MKHWQLVDSGGNLRGYRITKDNEHPSDDEDLTGLTAVPVTRAGKPGEKLVKGKWVEDVKLVEKEELKPFLNLTDSTILLLYMEATSAKKPKPWMDRIATEMGVTTPQAEKIVLELIKDRITALQDSVALKIDGAYRVTQATTIKDKRAQARRSREKLNG